MDFDRINIGAVSYKVKDTTARKQIGDETTARKQADTQLSQQISRQFGNIGKTPYANVLAYGADPTGTNDSSTAFNQAKNSGTVIFVQYGTYNIQSFRPEN